MYIIHYFDISHDLKIPKWEENKQNWYKAPKCGYQYQSITVHCPHLDDNLNPSPELLNEFCKCGKDGKCYKCDKFIGFYSENGTTFSFGSYEDFCDYKI